jgi:cell division topological specificity factor
MGLFDFFRRDRSASQAKERLQILVSHDRVGRESPDYLPLLQRDLIAVIARYVEIDEDKLTVELANDGISSMLAVNIELPKARQRPDVRNPGAGLRVRPQLA